LNAAPLIESRLFFCLFLKKVLVRLRQEFLPA
jgi:hypothetical protein